MRHALLGPVLCGTAAAILGLTVTTDAAALDAAAAEALMKKSGCMKCHSVDRKKDGPSFKETAAKYKGKAGRRRRRSSSTSPPIRRSRSTARRSGTTSSRPRTRARSRTWSRASCRAEPPSHDGLVRAATLSDSAARPARGITLGAGVVVGSARCRRRRAADRRRRRPRVDQHRGVLHRLPRDARQRLRRVQGHDPRQEPHRRARHLLRLPRAARAGRADVAQDAGELRGLGPPHRQDRHQGEVREAPLRDGGEASGRA